MGPGVPLSHQVHLQVHGRAPNHIGQGLTALVQAQILGVQFCADGIDELQAHARMGLGKPRQQSLAKRFERCRINHQIGGWVMGYGAWGLHGDAKSFQPGILPWARV